MRSFMQCQLHYFSVVGLVINAHCTTTNLFIKMIILLKFECNMSEQTLTSISQHMTSACRCVTFFNWQTNRLYAFCIRKLLLHLHKSHFGKRRVQLPENLLYGSCFSEHFWCQLFICILTGSYRPSMFIWIPVIQVTKIYNKLKGLDIFW